jgi:PHD/YefM family antitoxin component YafN of YafNO toxin-antitoxin module
MVRRSDYARSMTEPTEREKRLAEALRQNLRRRKEQAREKEPPAAGDKV